MQILFSCGSYYNFKDFCNLKIAAPVWNMADDDKVWLCRSIQKGTERYRRGVLLCLASLVCDARRVRSQLSFKRRLNV